MKVIHKSGAYAVGLFALGTISGVAGASTFTEFEPNDSKEAADVVRMGPNNHRAIRGHTIAPSGAGLDYFRIKTEADTLGIYKYTLTLSSFTSGHEATIRARSQWGVVPGPWTGSVGTHHMTDVAAQTQYIPTGTTNRVNSWFGFGRSEELYYRVTGSAATPGEYISTLSRTTVTPTHIGSFQPGRIVIQTVDQTTLDTDLWVYDANFHPIFGFGNDDASVDGGAPRGSFQSWLQRDFRPGVYYLALSRHNLALKMGSPSDDRSRSGFMLDYYGAVLSSSPTTTSVLANFQVIDSLGTHSFTGSGFEPHGINWYSMTVVPEPATMLALGMGSLLLAGRRLRKRN